MNNKGFMMAEVVVVSAIVLVFMTGMYVSYNKIFSIYNQRVDYYDVTTLYKLGFYRDELIDSSNYNNILNNSKNGPLKLSSDVISLDTGNLVYLIYNNKENLNSIVVDTFNSYDINLTFKDYVYFLSNSVILDSDYLMIMERCITKDNCKYAYLEVYSE